MGDDRLVPRGSAVYQEFARLYRLARTLRPTGADRWKGDLYATGTGRWGGFDPRTSAIRLSELDVLRYLTGTTSATSPRLQAQALATVLHETTHAGMEVDAPTEPNAVRSDHSEGVMEGFAELRTVEDFRAFTSRAGYPGLTLNEPQYPGAYAATESLMAQVAGSRLSREAIIDAGTRGPVVMHFDLLSDAVVRNRLGDVVPYRAEDRMAVRAALIETMKHEHWPTLPDRSAETGEAVAEDIRRALNAKVDEIRRHYQANPSRPFPADSPNAEAARAAVLDLRADATQHWTDQPAADADLGHLPAAGTARRAVQRQSAESGTEGELRFLSGQAPAAMATRHAPTLVDGARGAGSSRVPGVTRTTPSQPGPDGRGCN